MLIYILAGVGGVAGSLLRYGVSVLTDQWWTGSFPFEVLAVNCIGCFFLPFATLRFMASTPVPVQKAVTSGLIGSFTTFSAFSTETVLLWKAGANGTALLYVATSLAGGFLFTHLGATKGARK